MSLFGIHILTDDQVKALKAAGHTLEAAALTDAQAAVAKFKMLPEAQVVLADIKTVQDSTLSGPEKFAKVLATSLPLVMSYLTGTGLHDLVSNVEGIAREAVQSLVNDFKAAIA